MPALRLQTQKSALVRYVSCDDKFQLIFNFWVNRNHLGMVETLVHQMLHLKECGPRGCQPVVAEIGIADMCGARLCLGP